MYHGNRLSLFKNDQYESKNIPGKTMKVAMKTQHKENKT
jgi:hypothetical protein